LALRRVADLFRQVGSAFSRLEHALAVAESVTRDQFDQSSASYIGEHASDAGRAQEIERALDLVHDASSSARRTIQRVLSHPVYGLGAGEGSLTLDVKAGLAAAGGLEKSHLWLL
jgi:hypothetical protein